MFRLLFLLPIILCIGWYLFLNANQVPIKQGKKGFIYILAFSTCVLGFFILMIQVTEYVPNEL
jgi:heme/copper-type cytochrome/quinol oxidase subunit 3